MKSYPHKNKQTNKQTDRQKNKAKQKQTNKKQKNKTKQNKTKLDIVAVKDGVPCRIDPKMTPDVTFDSIMQIRLKLMFMYEFCGHAMECGRFKHFISTHVSL